MDEQAVPQGRATEINGRLVEWTTINGVDYAIYTEPTYRDKRFIDENNFKPDINYDVDVATRQVTPKFQGFSTMPRDLLVLLRALASWSLDGPIDDDSVQDLPLSATDALADAVQKIPAWKALWDVEADEAAEGGV